MTVLIVGGSKSGKSSLAQNVCAELAGDGPLYYLATMIPQDGEDEARIARHIEDRAGMGFETLEQGRDLTAVLSRAEKNGTFLLDSVTALLSNEFFPREKNYEPDPASGQRVAEDICTLSRQVRNLVVVADDLFRDAARYDPVTQSYRKALADILRRVAREADTVAEMSMGNLTVFKGGDLKCFCG